MVVWTVPEHNGGLDSPRARWWFGRSSSTRIVATVPEHEKCGRKPYATCTIIWRIYLSSYSVQSNMTRLVKKVDKYNTSYCLLILSSKQSLGTCKEVRQCGPSYTGNEEAHTLITKRHIYWHRSRGCENNHLRCVRTSPKNPRQTKWHNSWVKYSIG